MSSTSTPNANPPQSKRAGSPAIVWAIALIAVVILGFWLVKRQGRMVTELYRYYPASTLIYAELSPGQAAMNSIFNGLQPYLGTAQDAQTLKQTFEKDFKPQISLGIVPFATQNNRNQPPAALVILPLQQNITAQTLIQDFQWDKQPGVAIQNYNDRTVISWAQSPGAVAITHSALLLTNQSDMLTTGLKTFEGKNNIAANPLIKKHLHYLPQNRQGTFVAQTRDFYKFSTQALPASTVIAHAIVLQRELQEAMPVSLGSLQLSKSHQIIYEGFSPIDYKQIARNKTLVDALTHLMGNQASLSLATILPRNTVLYGAMTGLGTYYDLYRSQVASSDDKNQLNRINGALSNLNLDLRKNIVGFLDNRTAIAVISAAGAAPPQGALFLNSNAQTDKTLATLDTVFSKSQFFPLTTRKIDAYRSFNFVPLPTQYPVTLGYGKLLPQTTMVGTQGFFDALFPLGHLKLGTLAQNNLYHRLTQSFPDKQTAFFYVDVASMWQGYQQFIPPSTPFVFAPVLNHLQGIAGTTTVNNAGAVMASKVVVQLN